MVIVDNQGDVNKLVLLLLFIQLVQDHFVMFQELLKAVHHLLSFHDWRVSLAQNPPLLLYLPQSLSCPVLFTPSRGRTHPKPFSIPKQRLTLHVYMSAGAPSAQVQQVHMHSLRDPLVTDGLIF